MRVLGIALALMVAWPGQANADDQANVFYVDPGLVQSVYSETREETHNHDATWTVGALFGAMGTTSLVVESDLYEVDYATSRQYLPTGAVSMERSLWVTEYVSGDVAMQAGYTSYRDTVEAVSDNDITVEDNLVLQVIPVRLRHALNLHVADPKLITPQVMVEAGQTWIHQSGSLDGMESSAWQTAVGYGFGAVFLSDEKAGFGGIAVSSVASRSGGNKASWTHLIGSKLVL